MDTTLQVLMPMGGLGSRFAKAGYDIPKPLIIVDGKPMFMRALDSFRAVTNVRHIFVIRKEHDDLYDLAAQIVSQLPDAKILILDHDTAGAVETCLIARDAIDNTLPITIADCDIYFQSDAYFNRISAEDAPDGMLLTFDANDPRYSYVDIDSNGKAIRTAEKIVISNHAILGGYFFKNGALFKKLADEFIDGGLPDTLKEFYMSHLFNLLLADGGNIEIANIDQKFIFGTPEELTAYQQRAHEN